MDRRSVLRCILWLCSIEAMGNIVMRMGEKKFIQITRKGRHGIKKSSNAEKLDKIQAT